MYGINTLKKEIQVGKETIDCPVEGCSETVSRKRRGDKLEQKDLTCPTHKIEIRSSTFIYPKKEDNLLWTNEKDIALLNKIEGDKRESRFKNDNSEDAVTWNVFRYLDRENHLSNFVKMITNRPEKIEDIIYWSYSINQKKQWDLLAEAQKVFGEKKGRGSEPDIAIETDQSIILIEAKFNSGNDTEPSNPEKSLPLYSNGSDNWWKEVFREPLDTVANKRKRYELMRFWLLGSWMADQKDKDFYLINLVREASREKLETSFKPSIKESKESLGIRSLKRVNWEQIYSTLEDGNIHNEVLKNYFQNKISGFSASGKIKPAFNI